MRKLIRYLKDVLYAITALAKAFERIAECLEYFVEQDKKNTEKYDQALARLKTLTSEGKRGSLFDQSLYGDWFNRRNGL